jgi:hypothetical protein
MSDRRLTDAEYLALPVQSRRQLPISELPESIASCRWATEPNPQGTAEEVFGEQPVAPMPCTDRHCADSELIHFHAPTVAESITKAAPEEKRFSGPDDELLKEADEYAKNDAEFNFPVVKLVMRLAGNNILDTPTGPRQIWGVR